MMETRYNFEKEKNLLEIAMCLLRLALFWKVNNLLKEARKLYYSKTSIKFKSDTLFVVNNTIHIKIKKCLIKFWVKKT